MTTNDPKRWVTLALTSMAAFIIVLDNTVLNVAIPSILRDLHTTLPSVQWVISGYSLTFATLLIIGGRLGDMFGSRRLFIIGAAVFGVGSFIAAVSTNVPQLIAGEAVIEGIGASLMLPATLAILSNTFRGHERATAFATWGAIIGAGAAFGPLLGGYLTTYHSWRWAFGLNVIVAPVVAGGVALFVRRDVVTAVRERLDVPGALLVATGMFSLVFGITKADAYGWSGNHGIIPVSFVAAVVLLTSFVLLERSKERRDAQPLFPLSEFANRSFRYGVIVACLQSMGQLGMMFVVPIFLQNGRHLTAMENGWWGCPMGVSMLFSAQLGGWLTRRIGTARLVRIGLLINVGALTTEAFLLRPGVTFWQLLPVFLVYGLGSGFVSSQLTNVVLNGVPVDKAGAASGANSTARQTGAALGVAIVGAVFSTQIAHHGLAAAVKPAMLTGSGILVIAAGLSWLIPHVEQVVYAAGEQGVDIYDLVEPIDAQLEGPATVAT